MSIVVEDYHKAYGETMAVIAAVDLFLSRAFAKWGEAFLAVENLFDRVYSVGRTTNGVTSIGAPRLVRGGIRLAF